MRCSPSPPAAPCRTILPATPSRSWYPQPLRRRRTSASASLPNCGGDTVPQCATPTTRRNLLLLLPFAAAASAAPLPDLASAAAPLERYTDAAEGFTLLKPPSWVKVEKAGATALFEEEGKGSNSIGVVVSPVRLASLGDFGTPEFVADKLIQAERRKDIQEDMMIVHVSTIVEAYQFALLGEEKIQRSCQESTNNAEVITAAERSGSGGLLVYEFEYTVDSTRGGMKRIFSAAFVSNKKLFLLNIAHSDRPENSLDRETRTILEQVLHSFDTVS